MTKEQISKYKDHDEYVLECLNLAKAGLLKAYPVNDEYWRKVEERRKGRKEKQFSEDESKKI